MPATEPVAGDFTFTKAVNGGAAAAFTPTWVGWNATTKVASFTFTAIAGGEAAQSVVLAATYGTSTMSASAFLIVGVTVTDPAPPQWISLLVGQQFKVGGLTGIVAAADPATATITFAMLNLGVASVGETTGVVTGLAPGTNYVIVTATKTGYTSATATVTVVVSAVPTASVMVASETMSLTAGGPTGAIVATPNPATATVTFASGTEAVATVGLTTGVVTPVAAGTATITVTAAQTDYTSGTATVTVTVDARAVTTVEVAAVSVEENKTATTTVVVKDQVTNAMTSGFTLGYAVNNAVVSVNATTGVITAAAYNAAATTSTLTVTATPTTGTAKTGTATVTVTQDVTPPTLSSVTAVDATHIDVVFSEKVQETGAEDALNYTIFNPSTGTSKTLTGLTTAVLGTDAKTVHLTLTGTDMTWFGPAGLLAQQYYFYVDQSEAATVQDLAGVAAIINTSATFMGVITADTTKPVFLTAAWNAGTKTLTLNFSEIVQLADAQVDEIKIAVNTVSLVEADFGGVGNATTVAIGCGATTGNAINALTGDYVVALQAGAFKDVAGNLINASSVTATKTVQPAVTVVVYDETTNKVTATFNNAVKFNSVTNLTKFRIQYKVDTGAWTDLVTTGNFNTNFPLDTMSGTSGTSVVFKPNAAGIVLINAQKNTAGVLTYQFGIVDSAVQDTANTWNDTGAAGGTDEAFTAMTYTAETVAPTINEAKYYVATDATIPVPVVAKTMYVKFDQKVQGTIGAGKVVVKYGATPTTVDATVTGANIATVATLDTNGMGMTIVLTAGGQTNMADNTTTIKVGVLATSGLKDMNNNLMAAQEYAVQYIENTAVTEITATEHSSKQVFVTWTGGQLDETLAETVGNWSVYITGNPNATVSLSSAELIDTDASGVKETLVLKAATGSTFKFDAAVGGYYTVSYSNLKDTNATAITNGTAAMASLGAEDTAAPTVAAGILSGANILAAQYADVDTSSSVSAGDTLTLVFNEPVVAPAAALLQVEFGTVGTASAALGADTNKLVITFGTSPALAFGATAITANAIKDANANTFAGTGFVIAPDACAAPKPISAVALDVNGDGVLGLNDTITVTYDKPIFLKAGKTLADLDDDFAFTGGTVVVKSVALSGSTAIITLNTGSTVVCGTTTVDTDVANVDIQNSWKVAATTATAPIVVAGTDTVGSMITSVVYNDNAPTGNDANDVIVVTFNKPVIIDLSAMTIGDWVFANGTAPTSGFFVQTASDKLSIGVGILGGFDCTAGTTTLRMSVGINPAIKDVYGNSAVRTPATTITAGIAALQTAKVPAFVATVITSGTNNSTNYVADAIKAATTFKLNSSAACVAADKVMLQVTTSGGAGTFAVTANGAVSTTQDQTCNVTAVQDGNLTITARIYNSVTGLWSAWVSNTVCKKDIVAPTAPTAVTLTPVGGTVVANTLNATNTNLTASATITAGQATVGSAELLIGGASFTTPITDTAIAVGDTTVTFAAGTTTTAGLQAAITAGGVISVRLTDAAGNATVSTVANPTLVVDYVAPTAIAISAQDTIAAGASVTLTATGGPLADASWAAILTQIKANTAAGANWITGIAATDLTITPATDGVTATLTNGAAGAATIALDFVITAANVYDRAGNVAGADITIDSKL